MCDGSGFAFIGGGFDANRLMATRVRAGLEVRGGFTGQLQFLGFALSDVVDAVGVSAAGPGEVELWNATVSGSLGFPFAFEDVARFSAGNVLVAGMSRHCVALRDDASVATWERGDLTFAGSLFEACFPTPSFDTGVRPSF